jgi:hypothetical protein
MRGSEIIDDAFTMAGRKALGQALDGDTQGYGLRRLNQLIDSWSAQGIYIPFSTEIVQSVTGSPITIGTGGTINVTRPNFVRNITYFKIGGISYPIEWVNQENFNRIQIREIDTIPCYGWYEEGLPLGNLHFYPRPTNNELHLRIDATLPAFADYDTDYDIVAGYRNALVYTMAEIACEGVKNVPDDIARKAANARNTIKTNNTEAMGWPIQPIAMGLSRRGIRRSGFFGGY